MLLMLLLWFVRVGIRFQWGSGLGCRLVFLVWVRISIFNFSVEYSGPDENR